MTQRAQDQEDVRRDLIMRPRDGLPLLVHGSLMESEQSIVSRPSGW